MSLTYGFYNSQNHDRVYDAEDMSRIFDGIISDGVYQNIGKWLAVKASDMDNEVIVQPGRAWFNHTWTYINADYPVGAPEPETTTAYNRLDALVIDVDRTNRINSLQWVKGTPAAYGEYNGPVNRLPVPVLASSDEHKQYPLCYVVRRGRQNLIKATEIYNTIGVSITYATEETQRYGGQEMTGVLVPFVDHALGKYDITGIVARWDAEFDSWSEAKQDAFRIWMQERQNEYTDWFNNIKGTLSGDVGLALKNYIESLQVNFVGTKSGTSVRKQVIQVGGITFGGTQIPLTDLGSLYGSHTMEKTHTLNANTFTTCTFTNALIGDSDTAVDVFTDPQIDYIAIDRDGNSATIRFPKSSLGTINVRLRLLTEIM